MRETPITKGKGSKKNNVVPYERQSPENTGGEGIKNIAEKLRERDSFGIKSIRPDEKGMPLDFEIAV